jgi:hypothetical protein
MRLLALFVVGCGLSACHADTALDKVLTRLAMLEQKNAALEQKNSALEADNIALKEKTNDLDADNAEIKATLGAPAPGELRLFAADACPAGWAEFNRTQGYPLAGRPDGAKTGTQLNRPLEAGELGRAPPHDHAASALQVKDPGHDHGMAGGTFLTGATFRFGKSDFCTAGEVVPGGENCDDGDDSEGGYDFTSQPIAGYTNTSSTGVTVVDQPTEVTVEPNDSGEHLPLVYVLICQKVGVPPPSRVHLPRTRSGE